MHEASKACVVEELLCDTGVVAVEARDDVLNRRTFSTDQLSSVGKGAQGHRDTNIDGHLEPSLSSKSSR